MCFRSFPTLPYRKKLNYSRSIDRQNCDACSSSLQETTSVPAQFQVAPIWSCRTSFSVTGSEVTMIQRHPAIHKLGKKSGYLKKCEFVCYQTKKPSVNWWCKKKNPGLTFPRFHPWGFPRYPVYGHTCSHDHIHSVPITQS